MWKVKISVTRKTHLRIWGRKKISKRRTRIKESWNYDWLLNNRKRKRKVRKRTKKT